MSEMKAIRARGLLCVTATAGCLLSPSPEDGLRRKGGSTQARDAQQDLQSPRQPMTLPKIGAALWPKSRARVYRAPAPGQPQAVGALLEAAMRHVTGADAAALPTLASRAGLTLERWEVGAHRYLALLESDHSRGMIGAFVLRVGPPAPVERLLQAPHAYFDTGSGRLAMAAFFAQPAGFRALFTNTLHRYVQADGRKRKSAHNPADVCHHGAHPFVEATVGAARALPRVEVLQLHGFADDHAIPEAPNSQAIVSAGTDQGGSPRVAELAAALREAFATEVSRYPDDVGELGGTTNVIGQRVRDLADASFLHVELSSTLRQQLRQRPRWRQRLATALAPLGR